MLRVLGRLPPERVALSFRGRHPRPLNTAKRRWTERVWFTHDRRSVSRRPRSTYIISDRPGLHPVGETRKSGTGLGDRDRGRGGSGRGGSGRGGDRRSRDPLEPPSGAPEGGEF